MGESPLEIRCINLPGRLYIVVKWTFDGLGPSLSACRRCRVVTLFPLLVCPPETAACSQNGAQAEVDSAALPLEHRAVYGPPPPPGYGAPPPPGPDDPWPLAAPDMPMIKHLQVQCEKTHMRVNIEFDRPFYGMIFSKGKYAFHQIYIDQ